MNFLPLSASSVPLWQKPSSATTGVADALRVGARNPSALLPPPKGSLPAIAAIDQRIEAGSGRVTFPKRQSFKNFLLNDARVPIGGGHYGAYTFEGRELLEEIVATLDLILGSHTGQALTDSTVSLAGGAQFGKTVQELNLGAYITGQRFLNFGLYLPDDDLVEGIVDSKFRPDVVDQIGWFAEMTQVGKALNKSGKAVNRKGAFLVTDGERKAVGMIRGLGKVPTSFSMDVAAMDEVDDIKPRMEKFVRGRLTASKLRLVLKIGTQRIHGRGMNKAWKDGSQGVALLTCERCKKTHQPEENFPEIIRCAVGGTPKPTDPRLSFSADFRDEHSGVVVAQHDPLHHYYLACTGCGAPLNRHTQRWEHRRPDQIRLRHWSYRISQLSIAAIELSQIVGGWTRAVADPEAMTVFRCDVLALPQSTAQAITPDVLDRARTTESYELSPLLRDNCFAVGGLDMGDRCWYFAREIQSPAIKRIQAVEQIASANVVARTVALFQQHKLSALFVDQRPLVNEARTLALLLNGLADLKQWPSLPAEKNGWISFPGGLTWDGQHQRWLNLKCAVVRFDKRKIGAGITQGFDVFEEGGQTKFVPLIDCNRYETIDRVVREFLTPQENVVEIAGGAVRVEPAMRLPRKLVGGGVDGGGISGSIPILETLDAHLITGSERTKESDGTTGDYVDQAENHFMLANGYSALAEIICGRATVAPVAFATIEDGGRRRGGLW